MTHVFADSFYFFALLSERDSAHEQAISWSSTYPGRLLTTIWILVEVGDGLANSRQRDIFSAFYKSLCQDANVRLLGWEQSLFDSGLALYEDRPDKLWSLTDCISSPCSERVSAML